MKIFNTSRLQDLGILAAFVVVIQVALSKWIYPLFNSTTEQLFAITQQTAITSPTIGNKVIGVLTGIIPFELGALTIWVSMFIGAWVLLIAGYWVYSQTWAYKGKDIYQRLWFILLYGSVALYVLLLVTKIGAVATLALPLLIGVAINYAILAFVVTTAAKRFKFLRI